MASVPLPVEALPESESEAELLTLHIADFLQSFQKPLDLPRMTLPELREALSGDPYARGTAILRQAMQKITEVRLTPDHMHVRCLPGTAGRCLRHSALAWCDEAIMPRLAGRDPCA